MSTLRIKPGVLERLQEQSGIRADDAFARSLSITTTTLKNAKNGSKVGAGLVATICHVYGKTLLEVAEVAPSRQPAKAVA